MITDTFDNLSEEIIKVNRNDKAVKVDACILTFFSCNFKICFRKL